MDPIKASQDNLRRLEAELERLEGLLPTMEADGRPFWDRLRAVRDLLREVHPLRELDRERLEERLEALVADARSRKERVQAENASRIEGELDRLDALLSKGRREDFWDGVGKANELFRTLRPMDREAHDALWSRLDTLCDRAKEAQREARREFASASSAKARELLSSISRVREELSSAAGVGDLKRVGSAVHEVHEALHGVKEMAKEDLDTVWGEYKALLSELDAKRGELMSGNTERVLTKVRAARTLLERGRGKQAKEAVKEVHAFIKEHPLGDEEYRSVKEQLDGIWEGATAANREQYLQRQRERKAWLEERIAENDGRIGRIEREMDAVRDEVATATGDRADKLREELARKFRVIMRLRDLNRSNAKELEEIGKAILKGYKKG